jgi:hypothetical protein
MQNFSSGSFALNNNVSDHIWKNEYRVMKNDLRCINAVNLTVLS